MTILSYEQRHKAALARLEEIAQKHGRGWSDVPAVAREQVDLSMELEVCGRMIKKQEGTP